MQKAQRCSSRIDSVEAWMQMVQKHGWDTEGTGTSTKIGKWHRPEIYAGGTAAQQVHQGRQDVDVQATQQHDLYTDTDGTVTWKGHKHRQEGSTARTLRLRGTRHNPAISEAGTLAWWGRGHSRDIDAARMSTQEGHWATTTWTWLKHGHRCGPQEAPSYLT